MTRSRHYTPVQARIGGIRSGNSRRFQARERHAGVMDKKGVWTAERTARFFGYSRRHVFRLWSGAQRRVMTRIQTIAFLGVTRTNPLSNLDAETPDYVSSRGQLDETRLVRTRKPLKIWRTIRTRNGPLTYAHDLDRWPIPAVMAQLRAWGQL